MIIFTFRCWDKTEIYGVKLDIKKILICQGLKKHYGNVKAVDGIDFYINTGEVYGFLGPNGAGKTTTLEILEGLRKPDAGKITILGYDAQEDLKRIKERVGIQLQATALDDKIKVGEALSLFGSFFNQQADHQELLNLVSLKDKEYALYETLSGGQKQRLAVALALVNQPDLIFLDEPTTGLDPQARRNLWDIILKMKAASKTIILTTHYMEEAEKLCDRVAIIDHGKIISTGTPKKLIDDLNMNSSIHFITDVKINPQQFEALRGGQRVFVQGSEYTVHSGNLQETLADLLAMANDKRFVIEELSVTRATLEDVFLEMTGRSLRD
jgi:ABC-2 type transport system ATP-binding protein